METILLPIASLFVAIFLIIIYYGKKNVINKETKIYSKMLIVNVIYTMICIISYVYAKKIGHMFVMEMLQKVYMVTMLILIALMVIYNIIILNLKKETEKKLKKIIFLSLLVFSIAIIISPLGIINHGTVLTEYGLSHNITMIATTIYLFAVIITSIVLFVTNKHNLAKNIQFLVLVLLYLYALVVRIYYPTIMFENFFCSFILLIMSYTIENPDLKMLKKLEMAKAEAEKANRAKSDFLSSMSHEIRTPLNAIVGLSEDASSYKEKVPKEVVEDLEDIQNASHTLLEIIGNILDINKIESESLEIVEEEYNVKEEIESLAKLIPTKIGEKNIQFNLKIEKDIPEKLVGDKKHLKQIINNLISNAIKYTEEGKITLDVNCIVKKNLCYLKISVEDTGRGIKKEDIEKLFTKFERLDIEKNSVTEGTGLGLALTKELTEMMGGSIDVESKYKEGSIFFVTIPQKIGEKYQKEEKRQNVEILSIDYSKKKILIVDDNKLNIKVATKALSAFDFEIEECYDGEECLAKIQNGDKYDLILMDIMMPNMSGEVALQKLKELKEFDTPVIALTADALRGAKEKYLSEGFIDYIAKPFSKNEIKEKLDIVFEDKRDYKNKWDNIPVHIIE